PFTLTYQERLSPRSTLFPYTTLFRSQYAPVGSASCPGTQACQVADTGYDFADFLLGYPQQTSLQFGTDAIGRRAWASPGSHKKRDRKSTRLNSSHLVISYAVFCLK